MSSDSRGPVRAAGPDVARWRAEIDEERIRNSYAALSSIAVGTLLTTSFVVLILRDAIAARLLFAWAGVLWGNALVRIALSRRFHARRRTRDELPRWHAWMGWSLVGGSVVYGALPLLAGGQPGLLVIATAALAVGGTVSGATLTLAGSPRIMAATIVALTLPLVVVSLASHQSDIRYLTLGFASFLLVSAVTGRRNVQLLRDSLALRYENLDLADRLAEQRAAEADARARAESASRDKTRFLAAASHDLRQPLHALVLFSGALRSEPLGPRSTHLLDRVDQSIDALQRLLDGLLDISRLDAGVVAPRTRPFPVAALLRQLETLFGDAARARGLTLRVPATELWIDSDPDMVAQLVRNLVANAIRYTPRGGVLVCARRRGDRVRLEVWDTGIGIPDDRHDDIFREFHQLGNPERDRAQGVGLGLAIVERIARLLGTRVEVRSRLGRGSRFQCDLPATAPRPIEPAAAIPPSAPEVVHARPRVLVVDDDALAREALAVALESWGYQVIASGDAAQAAAAAAAHRDVALVVSDYRLPGQHTAVDALAAITERLGRTPPAVIVTGDTDPARIRDATVAGHPVLFKPVSPDRLRSTIAELLA